MNYSKARYLYFILSFFLVKSSHADLSGKFTVTLTKFLFNSCSFFWCGETFGSCWVFDLGAPSILVTNFLVKSATKSPISNHQFFCFKSSKCAVWFSCDCGLEMFIATQLYSTFWWLETEKSVIWNWWLGWWLHQKIGD